MAHPDGRKRIAVHEAAHAIAARLMGHIVTLVEIFDGASFNGQTQVTTVVEHDRTPPERDFFVKVAGYVAETIIFGNNDEDLCVTDKDRAWDAAAAHLVWGDNTALAELKRIHNERTPLQASDWPRLREALGVYQRLETECRSLLQAHRADLDAIAAHLEKHGSCEGKDLDAICAGTFVP